MNIATIIGLVLALAAINVMFMMNGGTPMAVTDFSSIIGTFGGIIGATFVSNPLNKVLGIPGIMMKTLKQPPDRSVEIITLFQRLSDSARRDGLLALESEANEIEDPFIKRGVMLVVDGSDSDVVENIMETDIELMEERHKANSTMFESIAAYCPVFGVIGTLMGMILVLGNLSDPDSLGPGIAVAFLGSLYGVATANIVFLPMSSKLKGLSAQEAREKRMVVQGLLAVQAGENSAIVREKLGSFMPASAFRKLDDSAPEAKAA
ncbi:MAG: motility protein A [Thermomicrobiales bacterium]